MTPNPHDLTTEAVDLLHRADRLRSAAFGRSRASRRRSRVASELEARANVHANVALAMMLCQQSVCGHGNLVAHDDQGGLCRP